MYFFNSLLFENLYRLSGMNSTTFSRTYFGNSVKYGKRYNNPSIMPISELIDLCNAIHISLSHFITTSEQVPFLKERSKYIINDSDFKRISMRPNSLQNLSPYLGTGKKVSINKLAGMLDMSKATLIFWMKNTEKIKTGDIINICNRLGIDLDVLFDDPNGELPKNTSNAEFDSTEYILDLSDLKRKMFLQQAEIGKLKQENLRMKEHLSLTECPANPSRPNIRPCWKANYVLVLSLNRLAGGKDILTTEETCTGNLSMPRLIEVCNELHICTRQRQYNRTFAGRNSRERRTVRNKNK